MKTLLASILVLFCAVGVAACNKTGSMKDSMTLAELEAVCQKLSSGSKEYEVVSGIHRTNGAGATEINGEKVLIANITLRDKNKKTATVTFEGQMLSEYDFKHLDQNAKYKKYNARFQKIIYDHKRLDDLKKNPNFKKRVYGVCGHVHEDDGGNKVLFHGEIETLTHLNDQGPA